MRTQPDIVAIIIKITLKNKHRHIKKKKKERIIRLVYINHDFSSL